MIYIKLFYEFIKIGLFTIGGGLATLPYLKDLAERTNWYSVDFITDMIAISESTPGPIGINMATYVGLNVGGLAGSIIATVGEIIPSIIIVILISRFFDKYKGNKSIKYAFYGIRPTVTALIATVGIEILFITLTRTSLLSINGLLNVDLVKLVLFIVIFYLIRKYNKHPIFYIFISGLFGILLKLD